MNWLALFNEARRDVHVMEFGPHVPFPQSDRAKADYAVKLAQALEWLGPKWCLHNERPPK